MLEKVAFGTRIQAAHPNQWFSTQCAYFQCVLLRPNLLQKVWLTGCKKSQERVPEKASFGARSLAAQSRDSVHRILRPFLKAHFWYSFGGPSSLQSWGVLAAKRARKGRSRQPKADCPTTCLSTQKPAHTLGAQLPTEMGLSG